MTTPISSSTITLKQDIINPVKKEVSATKAKKSKQRKRINPLSKIVSLLNEPPIRTGTDRYRKMVVVMSSGTVGEALTELKALTPPIGGSPDIKLAIKVEAIKLEPPVSLREKFENETGIA
jgi:hypothetical protein